MKYEIKKYKPEFQTDWDDFISRSANATFLHQRAYMDYHADRFEDFSLLIFKDEKLKSVLPAHRIKSKIFAHNGLTYSDFIFLPTSRIAERMELMQQTLLFLEQEGFEKIFIKNIPFIFQAKPNDANTYIYFQSGATISLIKAFFVIQTSDFQYNKDRKKNLKKFSNQTYSISNSIEYLEEFWRLVNANLQIKYHTQPVHSFEEITLLANRFPENIGLYTLHQQNKITSGALVYIFHNTLHFQYIQSLPSIKNKGVDNLIAYIIEQNKADFQYISFGSSEIAGNNLNKGLVYWKESFGARVYNQHYFEIPVRNHYLLKDILQ